MLFIVYFISLFNNETIVIFYMIISTVSLLNIYHPVARLVLFSFFLIQSYNIPLTMKILKYKCILRIFHYLITIIGFVLVFGLFTYYTFQPRDDKDMIIHILHNCLSFH